MARKAFWCILSAMGRPTIFTDQIADEICELLSGGHSLNSICKQDRFPPQATVFQWLSKHESFREKYARAREFWSESEFEKMLEIANTPQPGVTIKTLPDGSKETREGDMIEHRRLQVDTRKWALARMSPKKYGDRIHQNVSGADGEPLKIEITGVIPKQREKK